VNIKRIVAVSALVTSLMVVSGRAEASPKLHFLKSKKFWYAATVIVVPGTMTGVLATRSNGNTTFPVRPGTTATSTQTHPSRAH